MENTKLLVEQIFAEDPERAKRWAHLTKGLNSMDSIVMEMLLDNEAKYAAEVAVETAVSDIAAFTTFAFPLVRRIYPNLIAKNIVSIQPMSQPTGLVFYLDFKDEDGNKLDKTLDKAYSTKNGTVKTVKLELSKATVTAITKRLKATIDIEAQQDLKSYYKLDGSSLLLRTLADQIIREIDETIIDELFTAAATGDGAGNVNWSKTPLTADTTSEAKRAYRETLYESIADAATKIFKKSYRKPNFIVADPDSCSRLEKLEDFKMEEGATPGVLGIGRHLLGTLKRKYTVYEDPWLSAEKMLIGYKGGDWFDTGYAYAPYIPIYNTPMLTDPSDFKMKQGSMTRFGKKLINAGFYATLTITSS